MGGFANNCGEFRIYYRDSQWDYIKQGKPKEYYEKYSLDGEITNNKTGEEWDVKIPITLFVNIKLRKKYYGFEWKNDDEEEVSQLLVFLWNWLKEKNIDIFEYIYVSNPPNSYYSFNELKEKGYNWLYYLQTEIGDDEIYLGKKPKKHEIKSINDYIWISKNCLTRSYYK